MPAQDHYVRFDSFQVGLYSGELRKHGRKVRLQHHSFQVLALLLERAGQVVTREELHQKLWPEDTFVDFDAGLNTAIKRLRDALNDSAESPRFVETLPRRGYRFIAPIAEAVNEPLLDPEPRPYDLVSVSLPGAPPAKQLTDKTRAWTGISRRGHWVTLGLLLVAVLALIRVTPQEETRLAQVQQVVPGAYEAYLKGRYFWNQRTEDSLKKAVDYFQWATEKDPSYAPAYSGLADSYVAFAGFRVSPANDSYIKAKVAAVRALELDPRLPEALSALAMVHLYYEWNWVAAELAFKRALELNPDDGTTHMRYALALPYFGRFDDALREIARAREADPLSPVISANVGKILHLARRYEQAIEEHRKAVALDPNFGLAHNNLGLTLALTGSYEQAIAEFQRAIELSGNPEAKANLAYAYAMCGRSREAREILSELQTGTPQVYSSPFDLAVAYTGLGDRDRAFAWLEKAYEERARPLLSLKINPLFDPLHSDPRFAALIERMKVFDVR